MNCALVAAKKSVLFVGYITGKTSPNGIKKCCSNPHSYWFTKGFYYSQYQGFHGNQAATAKEIEISLPYGKIAGKTWGSESAYPVLCLHGWLLNAGVFDTLMPLLTDQFYFVAIDFPGHGKSCHLPPGGTYTTMSTLLDTKKVVDQMGWKTFHLMAHSMGGAFGFQFCSMFPELVDKFIALDAVKAYSKPPEEVLSFQMKAAHQLLDIEKKMASPAPVYDLTTAADKLIKAAFGEIDQDGAKLLLKRGSKISNCGSGLIFSRDLRCYPMQTLDLSSDAVIEAAISTLRCKLLMILSNGRNPEFRPETPEYEERVIDMYKQKLEHFVLERVDGNHFVHFNNPERVAPFINKFLLDKY